jgi:anti-sigma B factor antagonist
MNSSDSTVVNLEGPLDRDTVPKIRKNLLGMVRRKKKKIKELIVDFSQVPEMDTAGVALLVELLRTLSNQQSNLRLTHLNEKNKKVIHLARLAEVFEVEET